MIYPLTRLAAPFAVALTAAVASVPALAEAPTGWRLVASVGASHLPDVSTEISGTGDIDGAYRVHNDGGFSGGLGLRHRYADGWESEIAWEYRSNDTELVPTGGGASLSGGNYASNTFFLNARRYLGPVLGGEGYLGVGVFITQELDIDYEPPGGERSFEQGGAWGAQLLGGVIRPISDRWFVGGELRVASLTGETLDAESGTGTVGPIDYEPVSLQVHLGWAF
ncbi:MAG: hypothetical protein AAF460_03100 [Pseudomonadota bacterium]